MTQHAIPKDVIYGCVIHFIGLHAITTSNDKCSFNKLIKLSNILIAKV